MKITPVFFFGDRLLLQVFVLVDTTNFWSYEDNSCAEFCSNGVITLSYKSMVFLVDSSYVYSVIVVVE